MAATARPAEESSNPADAADRSADADLPIDEPAPVTNEVEETEPEKKEVEAEEDTGPVRPLMDISGEEESIDFRWYILKVQVNREDTIRDALTRKVKIAGLEKYFGEIVVPTEDVAEYNKSGKRRIVKRKLYPGYIVVNMAVNDDTWFLVRDTAGIGDFTGSAGKPAPLPEHEVEKLLRTGKPEEEGKSGVRTAIPFKHGDHVRVKDGHFQNFEGNVESIDEANGRVTVMINIFGRSTPVELEHWQIENV
jgi:transcriptional antiterminator NusG